MDLGRFEAVRERLRADPCFFAEAVLGFRVFPYQAALLRCQSKHIVACWARQTGKTTAITVKVIHFAFTNADTTTLIVSRGLRQSMTMFGVIEGFVKSNAALLESVVKSTRTMIQLSNGSRIIALPCGPDGASLRGYTADLVVMDEATDLCLDSWKRRGTEKVNFTPFDPKEVFRLAKELKLSSRGGTGKAG